MLSGAQSVCQNDIGDILNCLKQSYIELDFHCIAKMNSVDKISQPSKQEGGYSARVSLALNGNLKSCIVLFFCFGIHIYI